MESLQKRPGNNSARTETSGVMEGGTQETFHYIQCPLPKEEMA